MFLASLSPNIFLLTNILGHSTTPNWEGSLTLHSLCIISVNGNLNEEAFWLWIEVSPIIVKCSLPCWPPSITWHILTTEWSSNKTRWCKHLPSHSNRARVNLVYVMYGTDHTQSNLLFINSLSLAPSSTVMYTIRKLSDAHFRQHEDYRSYG